MPETNIHERLDRAVVNTNWTSIFSSTVAQHLPHSYLDHFPMIINIDVCLTSIPKKRFRFETWWILEESFENEV